MPDNQKEDCSEKEKEYKDAQENMTQAERTYSNTLSKFQNAYQNYLLATGAAETAVVVGAGSGALLAGGGAIPGAVIAGIIGASGILTAKNAVEDAITEMNDAKEDYLVAMGLVDTTKHTLEHCQKDKDVEILWNEIVVEEDVWEFAEEDLEEDDDVMEFTEDDLNEDDLDEDDMEEEEETWDFLVCEECGFMGETSEFFSRNEEYICPDCKSELDVD